MKSCTNCQRKISDSSIFCEKCGSRQPTTEECHYCGEDRILDVLKCGHQICSNCLDKWLENKNECPECRKPIKEEYQTTEISSGSLNSEGNALYNAPPLIDDIDICNYCNSSDIYIEGPQWDILFVCKNCKKRDVKPVSMLCSEYERNPPEIKSKLEVNPEVFTVCEHCHSKRVGIDGPQWDLVNVCYNCDRRNIQMIQITENQFI